MKFIATVSALALLMSQVTATPAAGCLQNHTITVTDSCTSVAAQFQITEAEFYSMNPGLHHSVAHDCDNLDTGKPFCVCMTSPCPVKEDATAATSAAAIVPSSAGAAVTTGVASALSSGASAASSVVASASSAVSSVASAATSVASAATSAASAAASSAAASTTPASSGAVGKTILGAMTAAFVVAATSALL